MLVNLWQWLAVAMGGALGALARGLLTVSVSAWHKGPFPWATLTVNALGSFLFGALFVVISQHLEAHAVWRMALLTGFLGAFTTFSTFSFDTLRLAQNGQPGLALANVAAQLVVCLSAVWLGYLAGTRY